jgi:hypothetical protein
VRAHTALQWRVAVCSAHLRSPSVTHSLASWLRTKGNEIRRFLMSPRGRSRIDAVQSAPDKSLQRSVNHEVLGRGRVVSAPMRAPRARVLTRQPAAAELSRQAP